MSSGAGTLLIGGSGFLGGAILRLFPQAISAGRTAPAAPNRHIPIPDLADLSPLEDVTFENVILCTGTSRHHELMRQPLSMALDMHLQPTIQVAEQLAGRRLRSFVRLSTVLLFDDAAGELPVTERSPINPYRNRYLLSQYLGEQAGEFYGAATLRLCNTFGPSVRPRTDIVHNVIVSLRESGRAVIDNREAERDFVFIDDAARAVMALADSGAKGLYVLGSGESHSIGEVADLLSGLSGGEVASLGRPITGIPSLRVDSSKLRTGTGWRPLVSLREGLAATWKEMNAARH